jgi:hypothetical protein
MEVAVDVVVVMVKEFKCTATLVSRRGDLHKKLRWYMACGKNVG